MKAQVLQNGMSKEKLVKDVQAQSFEKRNEKKSKGMHSFSLNENCFSKKDLTKEWKRKGARECTHSLWMRTVFQKEMWSNMWKIQTYSPSTWNVKSRKGMHSFLLDVKTQPLKWKRRARKCNHSLWIWIKHISFGELFKTNTGKIKLSG